MLQRQTMTAMSGVFSQCLHGSGNERRHEGDNDSSERPALVARLLWQQEQREPPVLCRQSFDQGCFRLGGKAGLVWAPRTSASAD
jgi:hypothetical protein